MKNTSHKKYYSVIFPPIMKIICIILFDWKLEINFIVSFDNLVFLFLDQDTDPRYFFVHFELSKIPMGTRIKGPSLGCP